MIRRQRKISFRLTAEEELAYAPLTMRWFSAGWSTLIRTALRDYHAAREKDESDKKAAFEEAKKKAEQLLAESDAIIAASKPKKTRKTRAKRAT